MTTGPSVCKLILVPTLISLAVTLVRLYGELHRWPEPLFGRDAGGNNSILGISWLAFGFAIYFAVRVGNAGFALERPGRAVLLTLAAPAVSILGLGLLFPIGQGPAPGKGNPLALVAGMAVVTAGVYLMRPGWPKYWDVMAAYALAARVPVIVVMLFAIRGGWGTHYDASPHSMQWLWDHWFRKFVDVGLVPQIFFWIPYTVLICGLFGVLVGGLRRRTPRG